MLEHDYNKSHACVFKIDCVILNLKLKTMDKNPITKQKCKYVTHKKCMKAFALELFLRVLSES